MGGMKLDETVRGGDGLLRLVILVMGISQVHLRLLGVTPVRETRFQRFVELDSAGIIAAVQLIMRFRIQLFHGPAASLIVGFRGCTTGKPHHQHCSDNVSFHD